MTDSSPTIVVPSTPPHNVTLPQGSINESLNGSIHGSINGSINCFHSESIPSYFNESNDSIDFLLGCFHLFQNETCETKDDWKIHGSSETRDDQLLHLPEFPPPSCVKNDLNPCVFAAGLGVDLKRNVRDVDGTFILRLRSDFYSLRVDVCSFHRELTKSDCLSEAGDERIHETASAEVKEPFIDSLKSNSLLSKILCLVDQMSALACSLLDNLEGLSKIWNEFVAPKDNLAKLRFYPDRGIEPLRISLMDRFQKRLPRLILTLTMHHCDLDRLENLLNGLEDLSATEKIQRCHDKSSALLDILHEIIRDLDTLAEMNT